MRGPTARPIPGLEIKHLQPDQPPPRLRFYNSNNARIKGKRVRVRVGYG